MRGLIRTAVLAVFAAIATGCATTPERLCDHGDAGLTLLPTPPPEAAGLLAALRADRPNAVNERRDHAVWLQSAAGDLLLCTYRRRPIITEDCGATVHRFVRTEAGYVGDTLSISACH